MRPLHFRPCFAVVALLFASITVVAAADDRRFEGERNLGHGFRLVNMATKTENSLEAVVHYSYLFFHDHEVGSANKPCISPTGRYAVYEEPASGRLLVFSVESLKVRSLTTNFIGVPAACHWNEPRETVTVDSFSKSRQTFQLTASEQIEGPDAR